VFLSLLLFAAQALPEGVADKHTIRVTTRETDRVIVEVADTGPGLSEEVARQLFDPFAATGVGLAIAETIVKDLGGEIEVETAPGKGTLFRVHLPKTTPRAAAAPVLPTNGDAAVVARGRVLVVDDEPLIASSLKRTLKDHEVTILPSGRSAIDTLEADGEFDLIFCDLMMPELTGMDVYEWLQKARPGLEERMVFMTGGAFTARATEFLRAVPNMRFEKPFELDKVRFFVRDYIAKVRA
jgi:CheY-like chemotaxis protein